MNTLSPFALAFLNMSLVPLFSASLSGMAMAGVPVLEVDPRLTSQRCSKCGHIERANRPKQALFKCKACGYTVQADFNACLNIAYKSLPDGYTSSGVGQLTWPTLRVFVNGAVSNSVVGDNHNLASSVKGIPSIH